MERRSFIKTMGAATLSLNTGLIDREGDIKTAADLQRFLLTIGDVSVKSVDRIIIGNPDTIIRKAGTVWMPYLKTLKEAVNKGVNVLIVHEPTFYTHWDLDNENQDNLFNKAREKYDKAISAKKKFIEDNEMVIIRCHDRVDIGGFGPSFALGQKLGLKNEDIIRSELFYNVYRIREDTAGNLACKVARMLKDLNQPGVAFYGDRNKLISSIGIGTGNYCDPMRFAHLDPDMYIAIDDVVRTWTQTTFAADTGIPLVVINHGTSEEMGVRLLNKYLSENIPSIEFIHFNQGCGYEWIS